MTEIYANNPKLKSFVKVSPDSLFPIQNLPFGIFRTTNTESCVGVRIGDYVLDLALCHDWAVFQDFDIDRKLFEQPYLNPLMALGRQKLRLLRNRIAEALGENDPYGIAGLSKTQIDHGYHAILSPISSVEMQMPVQIGDYTDFYSSLDHATNLGKMFRDPANALLPNWKHIPVGYHGRSSSIVISETPIQRPKGQVMPDGAEKPVFTESKMLDFELEVGFFVGKESKLGTRVSTAEAEEHIFGFVLLNDWSARDIQKWEYVPLGPFLAKNFGSSISAWVVSLDALEPFRVQGEPQDVEVLPYLQFEGKKHFDITLEVWLQPKNGEETKICTSNYKHLYWNISQHLAHHTINGCNLNIGDFMASGTISGKTPDSFGSMIELTWKGTNPIELKGGVLRRQIEDFDTVIIRGYGIQNGIKIGFGEVRTQILPALS